MLSTHWARPRVRIGAIAFTALLLAGFTAVLGAQAATSEVAVSPLTIVSGTANGTIDGFAANSHVDVDGHTQQADQNGRVTLVSAPLDGDGVLTLGFTDPDGKPQTVNVDLTDAVTGLPLTPGQVGGPLASTTHAVSFTTGSSTPSGGGGTGGAGTGGGSTGGGSGSGSTPAGAVTTPAGVSIPARSVVAGQARLVIAAVTFNATTVRSRTKPILMQLVVKDTRGYLVRDAIVFVRSVPEKRVHAIGEVRSNARGIALVTLKPTKLLPLHAGGRLTIFTRARKAGEPVNGGVSTRRLVSLRLGKKG